MAKVNRPATANKIVTFAHAAHALQLGLCNYNLLDVPKQQTCMKCAF